MIPPDPPFSSHILQAKSDSAHHTDLATKLHLGFNEVNFLDMVSGRELPA